MRTLRFRRGLALAVLILTIVPLLGGQPVGATSLVQERMAQRRHLQHQVARVRRSGSTAHRRLTHELSELDHGATLVSPRSMNSARWHQVEGRLTRGRRRLATAARRSDHATTEHIRSLRERVRALSAWLDIWGTFKTCPVSGPHLVNNDFGVIVRMPGVPVHVHQGNDITAATGTPIVAPFDGTAVVSPSVLGGYNAHLSAYGHLGPVNAGDVIGYVGSTGDASGPHDHFEWHPGNGGAIDPYPLLSAVC